MPTAAQAKRQRERARRELEADYKKQAREKLRELRGRLKNAKRERGRKLKRARIVCRAARRQVKPKARDIRARHAEAAKAEIEALRVAARTTCEVQRGRAEQKAARSLARAGAALDAESAYQATIARASRKPRLTKQDVRRAARERAHESDDEVAANLPEELQAVWRARAAKTKPTDRATRTEVFLDWAHNHSAEVQRIIAEDIDQQVAELVQAEAAMRRATRRRPTRADLRSAYGAEAVPF